MELYHNNDVLPKNLWFNSDDIINLEFIWPYKNNKYYTLMMYDIDTPSLYIHLLVINIPKNDIENGTIILNYIKPNPPSDTHRYIIDIFEQSGLIAAPKIDTRDRFPLLNFIEKNNLYLIDEKMIVSSSNEFYLANNNNNLSRNNLINNSIVDDPPNHYNINKKHTNIIKQNSDLNDRNQKYCSCVIKVAEKNTEVCNLEENWGKTISGKMCYSPYAVCAKSVGTTSRQCDMNYDYKTMTKEQLISFLNLKKIKVNRSLTKDQLLEIIKNKKL